MLFNVNKNARKSQSAHIGHSKKEMAGASTSLDLNKIMTYRERGMNTFLDIETVSLKTMMLMLGNRVGGVGGGGGGGEGVNMLYFLFL